MTFTKSRHAQWLEPKQTESVGQAYHSSHKNNRDTQLVWQMLKVIVHYGQYLIVMVHYYTHNKGDSWPSIIKCNNVYMHKVRVTVNYYW